MQYDQLPITPPQTPAQQHHLIAVTLAAHETQTTDATVIAEAFDRLGAMVVYVVQSDTQFVWDGFAWVYDTRTAFTYSGTKQTEMVTQQYDTDLMTWTNSFRLVTAYDGNGRPTSMTGYTWGDPDWVGSSKTSFTYDGSGNLTYSLFQTWGGTDWVNFGNSTMTYNGSLLATSIAQQWSGSAWSNAQKRVYTYSSGLLIEDLSQAWVGSWADAERTTYTYDGSNRMTLALSERWGVAGPWANWTKAEYAYDGATTNETLEVQSTWNGASWDKTRADTSKYSANRISELVTYFYQFGGSLYRTLYSYDGLGNLIEDIEQSGTGFSWLNSSRGVYVFVVSGIIGDVSSAGTPDGFEIGQNYPNPFNAGTVIPFSLPGSGEWTVKVCNIIGQEVRTFHGESEGGPVTVTWDGTDDHGEAVSSGVYFYRVESKYLTEARKMLLVR